MKRCEAVWASSAKSGRTRCKAQAAQLVVTPTELHRFCKQCTLSWTSLSLRGPRVCGVLPLHDRSNPENIHALRVKYSLENT